MSFEFYITPEEYAIAEQNGISSKVVEVRVRSLGWKKERALTEPKQKKTPLKDWSKVAEQNGISYECFRRRIKKYGFTEEEAAIRPLLDRRKNVMKAKQKQIVFSDEILSLLEKTGISYNTFYMRVKRGWGEKEAATHPVMTRREIGLLTKDKNGGCHVTR